jgi:folate-binding protein YgfZ
VAPAASGNNKKVEAGSASLFWDPMAQTYDWLRLLNGIAEGAADMGRESSIPLEANLDYFHGIDFHKGCYLGQELVARTHHQGQVRKRMFPFVATPYTLDVLLRQPDLLRQLEQVPLAASSEVLLPNGLLAPELALPYSSSATSTSTSNVPMIVPSGGEPLRVLRDLAAVRDAAAAATSSASARVPATMSPGTTIRYLSDHLSTGLAMVRLEHVAPAPTTDPVKAPAPAPGIHTVFAVGSRVIKLVLPLWWNSYATSLPWMTQVE